MNIVTIITKTIPPMDSKISFKKEDVVSIVNEIKSNTACVPIMIASEEILSIYVLSETFFSLLDKNFNMIYSKYITYYNKFDIINCLFNNGMLYSTEDYNILEKFLKSYTQNLYHTHEYISTELSNKNLPLVIYGDKSFRSRRFSFYGDKMVYDFTKILDTNKELKNNNKNEIESYNIYEQILLDCKFSNLSEQKQK